MFYSNLIAARTALMCDLALCLQCVVLVEQPDHKGGLFSVAAWQRLAARHVLYRMKCSQGCYSAATKKPTCLVGNHSRFQLKRTLTSSDKERIAREGKELVTRKRDHTGTIRITGKARELKSTQEYTLEFGRAIAKCWQVQHCDARPGFLPAHSFS